MGRFYFHLIENFVDKIIQHVRSRSSKLAFQFILVFESFTLRLVDFFCLHRVLMISIVSDSFCLFH